MPSNNPIVLKKARDNYRNTDHFKNVTRPKNRLQETKKHLKTKYNLTIEQVEHMRISQNNMCAICGKTFGTTQHTKGHIDHDHKTNKVRELLCAKCNIGIGLLMDDYTIVQRASEYLKKWSQ